MKSLHITMCHVEMLCNKPRLVCHASTILSFRAKQYTVLNQNRKQLSPDVNFRLLVSHTNELYILYIHTNTYIVSSSIVLR